MKINVGDTIHLKPQVVQDVNGTTIVTRRGYFFCLSDIDHVTPRGIMVGDVVVEKNLPKSTKRTVVAISGDWFWSTPPLYNFGSLTKRLCDYERVIDD